MGLIHELLPKVMADIGAIGKTHTNEHQRYRFRSVDDVLNHCHPVFVAHGITVTSCVREHRVSVTEKPDKKSLYHATMLMAVTFWAPDGTSVENVAAGEALDTNGDKASNKAMSAAFKYALFFGLCIPVDPRSISDSDRPRGKSKSAGGVNGSNGDHADPAAAAKASIRNAPNEGALAHLGTLADKRHADGGYTDEQHREINDAIEDRRAELRGRRTAVPRR